MSVGNGEGRIRNSEFGETLAPEAPFASEELVTRRPNQNALVRRNSFSIACQSVGCETMLN